MPLYEVQGQVNTYFCMGGLNNFKDVIFSSKNYKSVFK